MGLDSRDYYRPSGYGGFSFFPPIIKKLLIANGAVFLIQMLAQMVVYGYSFSGNPVSYDYLLTKYFALNPLGSGNFFVWQLITYQFMHGSFTHILFNMFALWMFGMEIESIMGSKKFLLFYLLSGVGAGLLQLLLSPVLGEGVGPTIGASGAVFGVMIAFAMSFPDRYIFIYFLIPIKAKYLIAIMIVFEFMSVSDPSLVAHLAHIGGAVTALIFILLDRRNHYNINNLFKSFKKPKSPSSSNYFRKPTFSVKKDDIQEAKFYDINDTYEKDDEVTQEEIDRILDKISQSGYQKLTEREKRVLFEASKKK
jgi:membrane associated rhomboid family serine protease